MAARIRMGGVYLDSRAEVGDLQDSTIWRSDGWSGDYQFSCTWGAPPTFAAPWFGPGKPVEIVRQGLVEWAGLAAEPKYEDGVWRISGYGHGSLGDNFDAVHDSDPGAPIAYLPTAVPNTAVDAAISRGLTWRRHDNLGTNPVADTDGKAGNLRQLLDRAAQAQGKRWHVDSHREITYRSDPVTPVWAIRPGSGFHGEADERLYTRMFFLYVASVDTAGQPTSFAMAYTEDNEAAAQFGGHREITVDGTQLGLLAAGAAQANVEGRFKLAGGRMGWTAGIDLTKLSLSRLGAGAADPMLVRAGDMARLYGVMDFRSQPCTRAAVELVLGEVQRNHAEGTVRGLPVGFVARDLEGAVADAQAPEAVIVA